MFQRTPDLKKGRPTVADERPRPTIPHSDNPPMREGGADSDVSNQSRNVSLCQVFAQVGQPAGPKGAYEKTADGKMKKPRTGGRAGLLGFLWGGTSDGREDRHRTFS